jgi:hypothetical protein
MRPRRLLLATAALSSLASCKEDRKPLPGNPKGALYEDGGAPIIQNMPANPKGTVYDAGAPEPPPPPVVDAGAGIDAPVIRRLPANPKGSHYDKRKKPPK